jgi:ATP-dependent RNA helicase RhlE
MSVAAWKSPNSQLEPKQANQRHGRNADRNPLVFESASHNPSNNNSVNRLRPNFATPANSGVHNPRSQGSPSSQHESTHKSTNFKHRRRIKLIPEESQSTGVVSVEDHSPIISNFKDDNDNTLTFEQLKLCAETVRSIKESGYISPTPIQAQTIPEVLQGRDVMASAQTGTGKTAAFILPIIELLQIEDRPKRLQVHSLILTPTRELAAQVEANARGYTKYLSLRSDAVFGGVSIRPQVKRLQSGVDILVATPGRLLDLINQRTIRFDNLKVLVLDEADRMLDMGFIRDIKKIIEFLPKDRQNMMFSATFSAPIKKLALGLLNDPVEIRASVQNQAAPTVEHLVHPCDMARKVDLLCHLIKTNQWKQVLVFARTKHGADKVVKILCHQHMKASAIHGNKSQGARTRALEGFKNGDVKILVATDIAARGIDIHQLPYVINLDLPNVAEDYVHRIGRTGRAGENGHAISLVAAEEALLLKAIEKFIGNPLPKVDVVGFEQKILKAEPLKQGGQRQRRPSQTGRTGRNSTTNYASSQERRSDWRKSSSRSSQGSRKSRQR